MNVLVGVRCLNVNLKITMREACLGFGITCILQSSASGRAWMDPKLLLASRLHCVLVALHCIAILDFFRLFFYPNSFIRTEETLYTYLKIIVFIWRWWNRCFFFSILWVPPLRLYTESLIHFILSLKQISANILVFDFCLCLHALPFCFQNSQTKPVFKKKLFLKAKILWRLWRQAWTSERASVLMYEKWLPVN